MMYYGYGPGWSPMGGIFDFILWILAIVVVVAIVRWMFGWNRYGRWHRRWGGPGMGQGTWQPPWMQNSALDILKERYAKGEIDKAEFDAKKKDLE